MIVVTHCGVKTRCEYIAAVRGRERVPTKPRRDDRRHTFLRLGMPTSRRLYLSVVHSHSRAPLFMYVYHLYALFNCIAFHENYSLYQREYTNSI